MHEFNAHYGRLKESTAAHLRLAPDGKSYTAAKWPLNPTVFGQEKSWEQAHCPKQQQRERDGERTLQCTGRNGCGRVKATSQFSGAQRRSRNKGDGRLCLACCPSRAATAV